MRLVLGLAVGASWGVGFGWNCVRLQTFGFPRPFLMLIPVLPLQIVSILGVYESIRNWVNNGELLFLTPWFSLAEQLVFILLAMVNLIAIQELWIRKSRTDKLIN